MNSRTARRATLGSVLLQALRSRALGEQRGLASAGNRIKRGEAPKIETFASEVTRKEKTEVGEWMGG